MTDKEASLDEQTLSHRKFGDVDQLLEELSKSSLVGIAICDAELRYLKINETLAAFNGLPVEAHIGKTVPEIIGQAALAVEPVMKSVLTTGQSAMNVEVVAEIPTRSEEGHWVVNFLPVKNSSGKTEQVIALVIEVTRLRRFEQCLLTIMRNLPRIRDQVTCVGLPDRTENDRMESWEGSIELLEQCLQEIRSVSQLLQPSSTSPGLAALTLRQESPRPSGIPSLHGTLPSEEHLASELVGKGASLLTPRETETVRLLANGKSNKEVAVTLGITTNTVETYRARIMLKLSLHSMTELVKYAIRSKLVGT
jgi:DNA-binding CsgD family transcriptional regulator/PAS domain-containing protein